VGRLRMAVAGAGLIGRRHIEEIQKSASAELTAVIDPAPAVAELAKEFGAPVYPSLADMFAAPIYPSLADMFAAGRPDGVILATPNQLHVQGGLECVEAGCRSSWRNRSATPSRARLGWWRPRRQGRAPADRTPPPAQSDHGTARKVVRSGVLGPIVAVMGSAVFYKPDDYFEVGGGWRRRPGGGPILLNLTHETNNLLSLVGDIVAVLAMVSNATRGFPVEDTAAMVFRFANGALGTFMLSDAAASARSWEQTSQENKDYASYDDEDAYVIAGTTCSLAIPTMRLKVFSSKRSWYEPFDTSSLDIDRSDPLANQVEHFAAVIRGEAEPIVSGRDGLKTLRVTEAVTEAAKTGQIVDTGLGSPSRAT
jgi:predicted dehydrogenase